MCGLLQPGNVHLPLLSVSRFFWAEGLRPVVPLDFRVFLGGSSAWSRSVLSTSPSGTGSRRSFSSLC